MIKNMKKYLGIFVFSLLITNVFADTTMYRGKRYNILVPLTYSALLSENNEVVTAEKKVDGSFNIFKPIECEGGAAKTKYGKKFNPQNPMETKTFHKGSHYELTVSIFGAKQPWKKVTINGEDYRLLGKEVYPRLKRNGNYFTIVGDEIFPTNKRKDGFISLTGVFIAPYVKENGKTFMLFAKDNYRGNMASFGGRFSPEDNADPFKTAYREFTEESIGTFEYQMESEEIKRRIEKPLDVLEESFGSNYHEHPEFLVTYFINFSGVDRDKIVKQFENDRKNLSLSAEQSEKELIMWVDVEILKEELIAWDNSPESSPCFEGEQIIHYFAGALRSEKGMQIIDKMLQS